MPESNRQTIHATSVAIDGRGLLIMGPSGAGKSDLALRLIDRGASLISDDYTAVTPLNGTLLLSAPPNIAGKMEIRHLGIVDIAHIEDVPAALAITLEDSPARMPETTPTFMLAGIALPLVALAGKEPAAPIKAEWVLRRILSGGGGKSTSLKTLEDAGWETVDNLPLILLDRLLAAPAPEGHAESDERPLAIGIDSRTRGFAADTILSVITSLRKRPGYHVEMLFLDCSDSVLERRFAETRRRHPLALDRPAADGIARERELLEPLRRAAEHVIDSSELASNGLQQAIRQRFADSFESTLTLLSFGFSRGVPRNADLMFDMRFLRNPDWDESLRDLTGLDEPVRAYVMDDALFEKAVGQIEELLKTVLPRYSEDGKAYVTVAFGCTGGRHRSVCVTEEIARRLRLAGFSPTVAHRNLESAQLDAYENRRRGEQGNEGRVV